ncbi:hypothetical protein AVEN_214257-1, partial [Araneus ventricosus]
MLCALCLRVSWNSLIVSLEALTALAYRQVNHQIFQFIKQMHTKQQRALKDRGNNQHSCPRPSEDPLLLSVRVAGHAAEAGGRRAGLRHLVHGLGLCLDGPRPDAGLFWRL